MKTSLIQAASKLQLITEPSRHTEKVFMVSQKYQLIKLYYPQFLVSKLVIYVTSQRKTVFPGPPRADHK